MKYEALITEGVNPDTVDIDLADTEEIVRMLHREDCRVAPAVGEVLPRIAEAVDRITERLRAGGRLFYVGAGTSGRLGVLDASECPPTFGTDPDLVVGVIAGGDRALRNAAEGAEDSFEQGAADLKARGLNEKDIVVGISASGSAPYVMGALSLARQVGAGTVALCNTPGSPSAREAELAIEPVVGPEAVMGSTRMKAGTAEKMVLNMLSTATMIKLGKVYKNLMVDLRPSNRKLKDRSVRILMQAAEVSRQEAEAALEKTGGRVKPAVLCLLCGCEPEEAEALLECEPSLRRAVELRKKEEN